MNLFEVLKKPIITEKSNTARENLQQYTFEVDKTSNKLEIRSAFEKLYDVKVESVRTMLRRGKYHRRGQHYGQPKLTKKAVVTLAEGQTLPFYEVE